MQRVLLAAVITAAVLIAGCSSNEAPPPEQSSTQPPNGHGAYAKCLQEHGASAAPGPVAGPPAGTDENTWHKATQACASMAPGPDAG